MPPARYAFWRVSLSNVLVNVASFTMSKSNSWHDFIGTASSYKRINKLLTFYFELITVSLQLRLAMCTPQLVQYSD